MNETLVTLVGHVATEPALRITTGGARVTSFRLASTERRFDKAVNGWRDANTTFFTVTTWRTMAENVSSSIVKGQPIVVHGRLRDSSYESKDGQWRTVLEVEAFALGHDLSRGVSEFTKGTVSSGVNIVRELEELDELEELGDVDLVTGEIRESRADDGFATPYDGAHLSPDADRSPGEAADELAAVPGAAPAAVSGEESPAAAGADAPRTRSGGRGGRATSAA
jgi:single-strand DNA-binding protein